MQNNTAVDRIHANIRKQQTNALISAHVGYIKHVNVTHWNTLEERVPHRLVRCSITDGPRACVHEQAFKR